MIKLRAHRVTVVRDETTRIARDVWEWELPILEAKHPEGYVIREDQTSEVEREAPPDPAEEIARLDRVYGNDDGQRPLVELVYGYRDKGVKDLQKRIEASICDGKAPARKKAPAKKKAAAAKAEAPEDPLGDE